LVEWFERLIISNKPRHFTMSLSTTQLSPSEPTLDFTEMFSDDHPSNESEITYPEGGLAAWTVAIGSWCSMTAALGIMNSLGVFEAYVSTNLLPSDSTNSIDWIFGIYVFLSYFCGVQIGPIFDARGPRMLLVMGSVFTLIGIFTLSVCTGKSSLLLFLFPSFSIVRDDKLRLGGYES
jgi:MFS family permease